jgi:hypothetical protein
MLGGTPKQRVATADRPRTSLSFPNDLTTDQSQIHRSYRGGASCPLSLSGILNFVFGGKKKTPPISGATS